MNSGIHPLWQQSCIKKTPHSAQPLLTSCCLQWGLCSAWLLLAPSLRWLLLALLLRACELGLWPHCIPICLHRNLACGKGLSSTTVFPEVRTTRTNFKVFEVFSFVTFIASLKGPCCLFGLTEQKLAWNLWKGRFWPCWLSGGAGIHSGMCLKATTSSPWDRGASESWDYTGSSSTLTVGQTDQSDPCVTGTGLELIEITLRQ